MQTFLGQGCFRFETIEFEVLTGVREDETGSGKKIAIEKTYSMVSNLKPKPFDVLLAIDVVVSVRRPPYLKS